MAKKKALTLDLQNRRELAVDGSTGVSIRRRCELLGLNRSGLFYQPVKVSEFELKIRHKIDEIYTRWPFYGSRRIAFKVSEELDTSINRKRVQRLMREMGIQAIGPKPNLSKPRKEHKVYPYLLRDFIVTRPNQVWSTDITYVRLDGGFSYLVAIIDWYSRYVLAWGLSNTMEADFCIEALEKALKLGKPDIFNTDQGAQFTCGDFVKVLQEAGISISMNGVGRCLDNIFVERLWRAVKYENIYVNGYGDLFEAFDGLEKYFNFYNTERPHQALENQRPAEVHIW